MSNETTPSGPQAAPGQPPDAEPYTVQIDSRYRIMNAEGEVIAQCRIYPLHGVLWLTDVWVDAKHRGRWLARKVITAALAYYGPHNEIWLNVLPYGNRAKDSERLFLFYSRFGFAKCVTPGAMVRRAGLLVEDEHGR